VDARHSMLDVFKSLADTGAPLSTLQRVLLITDGTVTDVLEAYAGERMTVVLLAQDFGPPVGPGLGFGLELDDGERVLRRSILLQGRETGTNFMYADSVISANRLDDDMLDGLLRGEKPLGRLLAEQKCETFREIVGLGKEPAGVNARHFRMSESDVLIFRTYRIVMRQQPIMRITEKFPSHFFAVG